MKKILLLLFALVAVNAHSQSVVIDGYINNAQGNPVTLFIDKNHLGIHPEVITAKTSDGNFSFTVNSEKEFMADLTYGTESYALFLAPGDTLHVAFTADLLNITIKLSGNGAAENLFLNKFIKKYGYSFNDSVMQNKIIPVGVDQYEIGLFDTRKNQQDYFKADSSFNSFSPAFKNYFANLVNYRYWTCLLAYPIIRANASTSILRVDELPQVMVDGLDKVKISNADALICDSYRNFLKYYVIYFTSKLNGFNKFTDYNLSMERKNVFAQTVLSGTPYQYWLSSFLVADFEKAQPSTIKRLYTSLVQSDKQSTYAAIVKEKCGAYMEKKDEIKKTVSASGSHALDGEYKIVDEKGKPVRFSDFKGKVVYVDFWASWCGPCRGEMPHSKELHHKFTDKQLKNLVFLYVSIDQDEVAWRKAVESIGMQGFQAWSAANWENGAGGFFHVNSIPRYMLIDKSGTIVDENAKRPSDPEIYGDILFLLK